MKTRKMISLFLCAAIATGGIGSVNVFASSEEKLVFEYFNTSMTVEWIQHIDEALRELGEENNFEVLNGDASRDINTQLSQVDTAINQGIDGAFLFVVDEGSATAVVDKFSNAGIPVIGETLKLKVNKIAARWHAKAVAQFFTFSKKGSDRIGPR